MPQSRIDPGIFAPIINRVKHGERTSVIDSIPAFIAAYDFWRVQVIDIEVAKESEYSSVDAAENPITLISIKDKFIPSKAFFFTYRKDFTFKKENHVYHDPHTDLDYTFIIFFFGNEASMLRAFFKFLKKTRPDLITGWYFEDFDIPYIINRCKRLGIDDYLQMSACLKVYSVKPKKKDDDGENKKDFDRHEYRNHIGGTTIFDMKWGYTRLQGLHSEGNGLMQTSIREVKFGKLSSAIGDETWYHDPVPPKFCVEGFYKFIVYGFYDVLLPELIEKKCYIIFTFFFITRFTSIEWEKLHHFSVAVDMAQLMYKDPSLFLPSKHYGKKSVNTEALKGALVDTPPKGIVPGLMIVSDASRLYPSLILDANLGMDTWIPPDEHDAWEGKDVVKLGNGDWFRKDIRSFLADLIIKLFALRDFTDKNLARYTIGDPMFDVWNNIKAAIKNLINTIYGSNGNPFTRTFHLPTARSTTYLGRELFQHNIKYGQIISNQTEKGIKIDDIYVSTKIIKKYGDTDSIMLHIPLNDLMLVIKVGKFFNKMMNKSLDIFCANRFMTRKYLKLELESVYLNMFFPVMLDTDEERGTKKNYCCYVLWHGGKLLTVPKFKVMGMQSKKSNTAPFSKDIQSNFLKTACKGGADFEKLQEYLVALAKNDATEEYKKYFSAIVKGASTDELREYLVSVIKNCKKHMQKNVCPKCSNRVYRVDANKEKKTTFRCKQCNVDYIDTKDLCYDASSILIIGTPYRFGKHAGQYSKGALAHKITVAMKQYHNIDTKKGETYMYIWIKGRGGKSGMVFATSPEIIKPIGGIEIDKDMTMEKLVRDKMENILPLFNIKWNEIYASGTAKPLDQFS